jgi:hypothetical protein
MDILEQGIQNIDTFTKKSIQKHKDILAKTLYDTAEKSNKSSHSFDKNCNRIFTDAKDFGTPSDESFNPHTVVEFREGKAHQVIDTWDKDHGILPNRKVMGTYYIDVCNTFAIKNDQLLCKEHNLVVTLKCNNGNCKNATMGCNHQASFHKLSCGCNYHSHFSNIYRIPTNNSYKRGESRNFLFNYRGASIFEVDNYLNIYHKDTGLYLMLHKTTFPDICFYLAREYTQLPDKDYYQIFLSKRIDKLNFQLNQSHYNSKDQRGTLLKNINQLVPETYERVFNLFNKFRKFQSFEQTENSTELELEAQSEKSNRLDPRDRIIEGLKLKLNETIKRCENSELILSDMVEKYNDKSTQIQHLEREKHLLEIKSKEEKHEIDTKFKNLYLELDKKRNTIREEITKISEEKDREAFALYERLNEAEVFRAKSEALGISISSIQKELERAQLEQKRLKDINIGITGQIRQEKYRNSKIKNDNSELIKQIEEYQIKTQELEKRKAELENTLGEKINECYELHTKISSLGNKSSNVLENALSDQIDDLQSELEELRNSNKEICIENKQIKIKYEKVMKNLSSLVE